MSRNLAVMSPDIVKYPWEGHITELRITVNPPNLYSPFILINPFNLGPNLSFG